MNYKNMILEFIIFLIITIVMGLFVIYNQDFENIKSKISKKVLEAKVVNVYANNHEDVRIEAQNTNYDIK